MSKVNSERRTAKDGFALVRLAVLVGVLCFAGPEANQGIYEFSLPEGKCKLVVPSVSIHILKFSRDGKWFLYAVSSRNETIIYREPWEAATSSSSRSATNAVMGD